MSDLSFPVPFGTLPVSRFGLGAVGRWLKVWRNRRAALALTQMDAHQLADIGITPGDVAAAFSGSAFDDPTETLAAFATERRLARRGLRHA